MIVLRLMATLGGAGIALQACFRRAASFFLSNFKSTESMMRKFCTEDPPFLSVYLVLEIFTAWEHHYSTPNSGERGIWGSALR